jgi:hypothetical protein
LTKPARNPDFDLGALMGAILGFSLSAALLSSPWFREVDWFYRYQTFFAGVLAVLGAVATTYVVMRQVAQTREIEVETLRREERSARPLLAFVLVHIQHYSLDCFRKLRSLEREVVERRGEDLEIPRQLDLPSLPTETFGSLQLNLKYGTTSAIAVISMLLSKLQVQHSRIRTIVVPEGDRSSIDLRSLHVYMADAAEIASLSTRLYAYSRGQLDEVDTQLKK